MSRLAPALLVAPVLLSACAVAPPTKPAVTGGTVTCTYRSTSQPAKRVDPPNGQNVPATGTSVVTLTFPNGPVQITLDQAAAPCTAHSFESLAQQGYFTDTKCHRLTSVPSLSVLQCGDPSGTGRGGAGYWFDDELAKTGAYTKGVVAMANAGPNTNGSQFFIVYADSTLPPNYTIFGHTDAAGLAVVSAIAAKGSDDANGSGDGHPLGDATIKAVAVG